MYVQDARAVLYLKCPVQLLAKIGLLRGPERPPRFALSTLTLRYFSCPDGCERARMPETALYLILYKIQVFEVFFFSWK